MDILVSSYLKLFAACFKAKFFEDFSELRKEDQFFADKEKILKNLFELLEELRADFQIDQEKFSLIKKILRQTTEIGQLPMTIRDQVKSMGDIFKSTVATAPPKQNSGEDSSMTQAYQVFLAKM